MDIATFESECRCGHQFDLPVLSSMSYGEFLYFDLNGGSPRYLLALNNPVWDNVSKIVDLTTEANDSAKGATIQKIMGKIADKPSTNTDYIQHSICPKCKSRNITEKDRRTGQIDVEELSFEQFKNHSKSEQRRIVVGLI